MVDQVVTQQPPANLPPNRGGNRRSSGFRFNKANHHGGGGDRRFPGRNNSHHQKSEGQENNRLRERKDSGQKQIRPSKSILEELADQSFAHLKVTPKARVISKIPDGHGCTIIGVRTPDGEMRSSMKYDRGLMLALSHSPFSISQPDEYGKLVGTNDDILPPFPRRYIPQEYVTYATPSTSDNSP